MSILKNLLLPLIFLPSILLVLLILGCFVLYAVAINYCSELRLLWRMRRCNRFLAPSRVKQQIEAHGGTLIVDSPTLGWNIKHAWWTPDAVLAISPFAAAKVEDYEHALKEGNCLDWDKWCWDNYTCPDHGRAFLLQVWNGESTDRKLKRQFPNLVVVRTWTAFVHFRKPPG